jgi:hypothetical protein
MNFFLNLLGKFCEFTPSFFRKPLPYYTGSFQTGDIFSKIYHSKESHKWGLRGITKDVTETLIFFWLWFQKSLYKWFCWQYLGYFPLHNLFHKICKHGSFLRITILNIFFKKSKKTILLKFLFYYFKNLCKNIFRKFYVCAPWGQSHKNFWHKFTYIFCKLDHFTTISNIDCIVMKRSSLQKESLNCTRNVLWYGPQVPYSQHFIFLVTCKWCQ